MALWPKTRTEEPAPAETWPVEAALNRGINEYEQGDKDAELMYYALMDARKRLKELTA